MALPADYQTCHITGRFVDILGAPIEGSITFSARANRIVSAATLTIVVPSPIKAVLDVNGQLDVNIPATDDPDILPNGFTYQVAETFKNGGGSEYSINAPVGVTVDLSTVVAVNPGSGATIVTGPAGVGVPTGGTTGQVLAKLSGTNYATAWADPAGGGGGVPTSRTVNGHPLTADVVVTKTDLSIGNVDNTSDLNKPVSNATTTALGLKVGTGDSRLTDARTPVAHTHDGADITTGTVNKARLGTGSATAGKYVDGGTGAWTVLPGGGSGATSAAYVVASDDASSEWVASANATVTAGTDAATAIGTAFASGRKTIQLAGNLTLLSAVSVTPPDDCTIQCVDGGRILCGPQVGATPDSPPVLLTITGSRTTVTTSATLPIAASSKTATFSSVTGITAGSWVMLHTTFLFGPNRSTEQTGEIIKVRSISGTTLTFDRPTRYTYPSGSTCTLARYTMPKRLRLVDLAMVGSATTMVRQRPLLVRYIEGVKVVRGSFTGGQSWLHALRLEECLSVDLDVRADDVNDRHGSDSSYASAATTLAASATSGATTLTVASSTGFPTPGAGFAWSGNPGATDPDQLIESTVVVGGEPVRVINIVGTTWTLAAPGLVSSKASAATVAKNNSYLGYGVEIVGCENVRGRVDGDRCRHVVDAKSFNTRPCAFDVVLTGHATGCAGPPFSSHGSSDQVTYHDTVAEGCGGGEVYRGLNNRSYRHTSMHPRRWTRSIYEKTQAYPAAVWIGEGTDDGGFSGDNLIVEDLSLDTLSAGIEMAGIWCRDRALNVRVTGRRYLAPTTMGVWFAGPATSGIIDIAVDGVNQFTLLGTAERQQSAVQFATETGGTSGMSVRSMDVRVKDRACRGPAVHIEGFATNVTGSNSQVTVDVEKLALGSGQTSSTAQLVYTYYHNWLAARLTVEGTLQASAINGTFGALASTPVRFIYPTAYSNAVLTN